MFPDMKSFFILATDCTGEQTQLVGFAVQSGGYKWKGTFALQVFCFVIVKVTMAKLCKYSEMQPLLNN